MKVLHQLCGIQPPEKKEKKMNGFKYKTAISGCRLYAWDWLKSQKETICASRVYMDFCLKLK